jgi:hypothetical protein
VDFALKIKMELVVRDGVVPGILAILRRSLGVAEADEARLLLSEAVEVVRVRTGERADEAADRTRSSLVSAEP